MKVFCKVVFYLQMWVSIVHVRTCMCVHVVSCGYTESDELCDVNLMSVGKSTLAVGRYRDGGS